MGHVIKISLLMPMGELIAGTLDNERVGVALVEHLEGDPNSDIAAFTNQGVCHVEIKEPGGSTGPNVFWTDDLDDKG